MDGKYNKMSGMNKIDSWPLFLVGLQFVLSLETQDLYFCLAGLVLLLFSLAVGLSTASGQTPVVFFDKAQIEQSDLGDCWFLAGVSPLCNSNNLLAWVCVAWDVKCGVYGFVFWRDGGWTSVVVEDYLYITAKDFHRTQAGHQDRFDNRRVIWKDTYQTGFSSLHFASCGTSEYFWLPLLEKAYVKTHGDYQALSLGWTADSIQDLTGCVVDYVNCDILLDPDKLWAELRAVSGEHIFALDTPNGSSRASCDNLVFDHAYSIEGGFDYFDIWTCKWKQLVKIGNPWATRQGVWRGAWGDRSKE
ncbi:Putative cysteine peptidase, cysteine active, peptidase C2, calpain, catalytic [Septoria linicola]|uniref:Cysteine peptidase, cysteine active, peptidase C2, calpain, catalytic n=1 Tax=Septoria linicola TaxID=215465 RepID=A0A9Q9ASG5_9PEZI|nr:putative cysteine peptidase, cysteine active, peptidase C2, calpain, catalytic [Septoria linicola]USW51313.1 Putative cysteine peptidase, cysteine active, peptidase C2, calpain, catalytic [Septoria linicola]